jgi:hypothetical protein
MSKDSALTEALIDRLDEALPLLKRIADNTDILRLSVHEAATQIPGAGGLTEKKSTLKVKVT